MGGRVEAWGGYEQDVERAVCGMWASLQCMAECAWLMSWLMSPSHEFALSPTETTLHLPRHHKPRVCFSRSLQCPARYNAPHCPAH